MTPPPNKLIYLESLRGVAALVVVLYHFKLAFLYNTLDPGFDRIAAGDVTLNAWARPILSIFLNGPFAVRLFFVLSGFVLSISFFRTRQPAVLTSAALRRYPRLMIPAFASVMFAWVIQQLNGYQNLAAAAVMHQQADAWLNSRSLDHVSFIQALRQGAFGTFFQFDVARTLNPSLWTMPIELAGSFFVFSFLALVGTLPKRILVYLTLAVFLLITKNPYMLDFLGGIALADFFVHREITGNTRTLSTWSSILIVSVAVTLGGLAVSLTCVPHPIHYGLLQIVPTFASLLIVAAAVFSSSLQDALEHPFISFFGRLSFPIYLFHLPILWSFGCGLYVYLSGLYFSHLSASIVTSLLCLAAILVVSWGAYFIVELPAIRAGSILAKFLHLPLPTRLGRDPKSSQ